MDENTPVVAPAESRPLQSKKFIGYLVAEGTWKTILMVLIILGMKNATIDLIVGSIALAIVIIAGFIEAGYIIGQASLDKYTRIAEIAAQNGKSFTMKGLTVAAGVHPPGTPLPEEAPAATPTPTPKKARPNKPAG